MLVKTFLKLTLAAKNSGEVAIKGHCYKTSRRIKTWTSYCQRSGKQHWNIWLSHKNIIYLQVHRKFPPLRWRARLPSVNILWPRGTQTCSRRQREGNQPDKTDFQKYIARQPTDHPDIKEGDVGNTRRALSDPTWNKWMLKSIELSSDTVVI